LGPPSPRCAKHPPWKTHPLLPSPTAYPGQNGLRVGGTQLVNCFNPTFQRNPSHNKLGSLNPHGQHEVCMYADCSSAREGARRQSVLLPFHEDTAIENCLHDRHDSPHNSGNRFFVNPIPPSLGKMALGLGGRN
jgi:hypothetical protein